MLTLILLVAALILLLLAAFNFTHQKVNPLAAGLACWVASQLLERL